MCNHTGQCYTYVLLAYLTYRGTLLRHSNVFIHSTFPLYFVYLMMALLEPKCVGNFKKYIYCIKCELSRILIKDREITDEQRKIFLKY